MPQHVLVPLDGSEHGFAGLEYSFASFPDATVTALHVVDPGRDDVATVGTTESPADRDETRGEQLLDRADERADDLGRHLQTQLRTGSPHTEILAAAAETEIDHIVMGSHGESPITRPFLGRVSEAVVRRAPVSTTIVPETPSSLAERDLPGKVLVPVDESEGAAAALAYALETFPDGKHTAFHVVEFPLDRPREAAQGTYLEEVLAALESRGADVLAETEARAESLGASIDSATATGEPAPTIVEYAAENDFDQIIMGSHGRSRRSPLDTGRVAERVVRRSPLPVTLVRGEA